MHQPIASMEERRHFAQAQHDLRESGCERAGTVLARIGDKWSMLIVVILSNGPARFNELRRVMAGVSQRMLTRSLRGLEREGLVKRTVTNSAPPRVDYELTSLGRSIYKPVMELCMWAHRHIDVIEVHRQVYDTREQNLW